MKNYRIVIPLTWLFRLMARRLGIIASLLLLAVNAQAAIPELCGNGVDDGDSSGTAGACPAGYTDAVYGTGCDLQCPGNDKDNDGFVASLDCDDNNRLVFPGEYYPCDAGGGANSGYRICNVGGSYGTCTSNATPLCESTGSGVCKYIDCGSGNNSNPGTYASPYLTLGKISGGAPGSPPSSPFTLGAGDVVYIKGTTDCSTTFSNGSVSEHAYLSTDGTSSDPIVIKRYPGATAKIIVESAERGIEAFGVSHLHLKDLHFSGSGTGQGLVAYLASSDHVNISRSIFTDAAGDGNNNFACVYGGSATDVTVSHSFFKDCYGSTGNQSNVSSIKFINDDTGGDHTVTRNVIWYTRATNSSCAITDKCGDCVRFKHGATEAGAGTNEISFNYCIWPRLGVSSDTAGNWVHHNLFVEPTGSGTTDQNRSVWFDGQDPDSNGNGNSIVEYNTVVNGQLLGQRPKYGVGEDVIVRYNVATDDATSYNIDNGFYKVDPYGSDAQEDEYAAGILSTDNNCYYNGATSLRFNYYQAPNGSGGSGPAGDAGGQYTFIQWQALGYDSASFVENPTFDSYYRATSTNCDDKGWMLADTPSVFGGGAQALFKGRGKI